MITKSQLTWWLQRETHFLIEITMSFADITEKPAVSILRIVKKNFSTNKLPINMMQYLQQCDLHRSYDNFKLHVL